MTYLNQRKRLQEGLLKCAGVFILVSLGGCGGGGGGSASAPELLPIPSPTFIPTPLPSAFPTPAAPRPAPTAVPTSPPAAIVTGTLYVRVGQRDLGHTNYPTGAVDVYFDGRLLGEVTDNPGTKLFTLPNLRVGDRHRVEVKVTRFTLGTVQAPLDVGVSGTLASQNPLASSTFIFPDGRAGASLGNFFGARGSGSVIATVYKAKAL